MNFRIVGDLDSQLRQWLAQGLRRELERQGHVYEDSSSKEVRLVINFVDPDRPRPYRRRARATFVCSVAEAPTPPQDVLKAGYPLLIRSLSNLLLYVVPDGQKVDTYFVTLEQGYYSVTYDTDEREYFARH